MKNIQQIRAAILANRGGLEESSDTQIMIIWRSLDEKTKKQYLESINKERKKSDATGNKS